ncbi:MAG: InlB B-repeat-containing protein, partial [Coriobacteriia bacterium]|nr:InlB B-repeat-containing protein [Coriobacteriia bacterium]
MRTRKPSSRGNSPATVIARSGEAATRQSSNLRATASEAEGRPRQSSSLRRRALMMVLSVAMLLQLIAPAATPQVASADTPSANNTTIATWVRTSSTMEQSGSEDFIKASNLPTYTDPVNGILRCKPNALCGQDITQKVEVRLDVNWREPIPGGTITFTVPYGTNTVTLGGDPSTAANAASVSLQARGTAANQAAPGQPRTCTITLKSDMTPGSMFNIFYVLTFTQGSQCFDGDTGDLTPHLNQSGTEIAVGEALSVTSACKTIPYACLQLASNPRTPQCIGPNPNFATDVIPFLSPTTAQTAKVGPTYILSPGILTHMPDARADYTSGSYSSASAPKTLTITITLPAEATLAPTQVAAFSNYTQSTVNIAGQDHIVLTTTAIVSVGYAAIQSTIRPSAPSIAVIYTAPPSGGASSYTYDVKATGTWYDDSPIGQIESPDITQLYSTDVVKVNYTATARSCVTFAPSPDYPGNFGSVTDYYGATNESSALVPGDYTTLNYQLNNNQSTGEAALNDVSYTIPFPSGDLLDISDFIVNSSIVANPLVKDYLDKMTVTYSDNDSATFSFDDPTIFSQTVVMNGGGTALYPTGYVTTAAPANWIMNGKADSVYITQIKITQKQPLAYGDTVSFNFKARLRNKRHSGPDIIPGTDTVQTQMTTTVTPEDGTSTPQNKSATAQTYPIYATTDDIPLGKPSMIASSTFAGLPTNTSAGTEVPLTNAIRYNAPSINYNARIHNPTVWLAVPDYLQIDASSLTLSIGSGTANTPTIANGNLRQIADTDAQIHPADTSHAGVNLYAITYYGDLHALQDWWLQVNYKLIIPDGTPAKVNVPIRAFYTAEGVSGAWSLGSGVSIGDPYDLDGDGNTTANIMAQQATFTILVPSIISNTTVANADQEASTTWKKDGFNIPSSPWAVSNLARAKGTATLRSTVSNGTGTSCSGTVYTALPSGDFTPSLTGVSLNQVSLVTGISAAASATYAYTTVTGTDPDLITSWTTFSDPADVPANATYLRFTGITLPASTRVDVVTTYKIPDDAEQGEIVRANEVADLDTIDGRYYATTNSAGFVISKPSYIVNYYQDSLDSANLIGSSDEIDAVVGSTVDLASGTVNGQLDFKRPPGYKEGKQQNAPFIVRDATGTIPDLATGNCNIIDVLYTNSVYTVHYDADGGTPSSYLDSDMLLWDSSGFLPTTSPERTGYTFNGWKSPDTDVIAGPSTPYSALVADDSVAEVTLVADW